MSTQPFPSFGSLLKQHRRRAGLTQEELAERAGVSVDAISALERGVHRTPHKDTLDLLADALHLPLEVRAQLAAAARGRSAPATSSSVWSAPGAGSGGGVVPLVGRKEEVTLIERHLA